MTRRAAVPDIGTPKICSCSRARGYHINLTQNHQEQIKSNMTSLVQLLKLLLSQASSSDQRDLAAQAAEASSLHAKAWGRKWPDTFQGTICLSDLQPRPTTTTKGKAVTQAVESVEPINGHYEEEDIVEDILSVQRDTLTYDYMKGMKEVAYYLGALSWVEDCLVIREDYPYLLKELEKLSGRTQAVAILGQPGNGVSIFLNGYDIPR